MGSTSKAMRRSWSASLIAMLAAASVSAQTSQPPTPAPAQTPAPVPGVVNVGPSRELKLADNTWFRFAVQVQAWLQAHQDRLSTGSDGSYGYDFICRRCRFFTTGSVVKNVFFNFLFEAGNTGKADATTGVKAPTTPQVLDAYGQVKFADAFWLSAGQILLPVSRNGTQPTTTYLTLDTANVTSTPVLQGNSYVLRDLGIQANGFFMDNHLEYRLGVFSGSRQPSPGTAAQVAAGTAQTASHNAPRFVGYLLFNFWDPEVGYVNGGHYYGTKKVLGVMANADYQIFRKDAPSLATGFPAVGQDKNPYYGFSGAVFINYPLSGQPSKTGGDEIAGLAQFGYYDGGLTFASPTATVPSNGGTYPNVLKQTNFLGELAYYNHAGKFSIFGKYEKRKVSDDYPVTLRAASNQTWIQGGLKYYIAPANLMNLTLAYERTLFDSVDQIPVSGPLQQGGTNTVTLAWQTLLY